MESVVTVNSVQKKMTTEEQMKLVSKVYLVEKASVELVNSMAYACTVNQIGLLEVIYHTVDVCH
jgi:hypothetical protein